MREHAHCVALLAFRERPIDVVTGYDAGTVRAASPRADCTSAGSAGWRR
jgi:hypothetical protein